MNFLILAVMIANPGPPAIPNPSQVPWPVRLGAQSLSRSNEIPMVDQVVIVPNIDTFLDELARWSTDGQWPVLIADDDLNAMFIRTMKPASVIVRSAIPPPESGRIERLNLILERVWQGGPNPSAGGTRPPGPVPPLGLVLTEERSDAFPAAAALAIGRGQVVGTIEGSFGGPGTVLNQQRAKALSDLVRSRCAETGLEWSKIGDQLDVITLCRNLPASVRMQWPPAGRVTGASIDPDDPLAITDVLGRNEDGTRFAMVGWINGTPSETAYVAMCSLFLKPTTALLMNGYPASGQWLSYAMTEAATTLDQAGFEATVVEEASLPKLRALSVGGLNFDLILMNSKGNRDFFDLGSGRGTPNDVPVLATPAALSMIHSWSLQNPSNTGTVGGRWLRHGVYAYIGSSYEPFLPAFVPATTFTKRLAVLVPFLIAGRWWDNQGPFANAWRVNTLGDPLMTAGPTKLNSKQRIPGNESQSASNRGRDLRSEVETLMRQVATEPTPERLERTLRLLVLLGEDELARQMWIYGQQHEVRSAPAASIMLGPLFRLRDRAAFVNAWEMMNSHSQLQRDMLWQLLGPSLASSTDDKILTLLEQEVTGPTPSNYIEILGPHLAQRFGPGAVSQLIQRASRQARSGQEKQRLRGLSQKYREGR